MFVLWVKNIYVKSVNDSPYLQNESCDAMKAVLLQKYMYIR